MRAYLRAHRFLVGLVASLIILQATFLAWGSVVTASPLDVPVALSPPEPVQTAIRVPIPENYRLELAFEKAGHDFDVLDRLLGGSMLTKGMPAEPGVHVPVRWSLTDAATGEVAASGEADSFGVKGYGRDRIFRRLGNVAVPAGDYVFHAQVLHDVYPLRRVEARLLMRLDAKWYSTWQMWLYGWGDLVLALTMPVTAILMLLLTIDIVHATLRARERSRPAGV